MKGAPGKKRGLKVAGEGGGGGFEGEIEEGSQEGFSFPLPTVETC